ncbi:MAG: alpha/beta hydrolase [Pseudomonadota bacterium]
MLATSLSACSSVGFFVANAAVPFTASRRTTDLAYGVDARQRLDVFAPKAGEHPIVVFFYGGSWTMGKKSQYGFVGAALSAHGYVTVIPDYRLYPQVRFPEFVDDAAQAVAWVRMHAKEFGGNPDKIILMGHSAGAHMAAMLALNDIYLARAGVPHDSIVGLVGLSGPYDLVPNTDTLNAIFSAPSTPQDWQPLRFASKRSPPALLLHGSDDKLVYVSNTQKLTDALQSLGIRAQAHIYPGRGHADTIASFAPVARFRTPALEDTLKFLGSVTATGAN